MGTLGAPISLKERQRAQREVLILDEAERMLEDGVVEELVLEHLAERVGIGKGTIYLHFPRKEDLLAAVLIRALARLNARIAVLSDQPGSAEERLRQAAATMLDGRMQWMHVLQAPQRSEVLETMKHHPAMREQMQALIRAISRVIAEGQAGGEFTEAIAPHAGTLLLLAAVRLLSVKGALEDLGLAQEQAQQAMLAMCFHGLCRRGPVEGEERDDGHHKY